VFSDLFFCFYNCDLFCTSRPPYYIIIKITPKHNTSEPLKQAKETRDYWRNPLHSFSCVSVSVCSLLHPLLSAGRKRDTTPLKHGETRRRFAPASHIRPRNAPQAHSHTFLPL